MAELTQGAVLDPDAIVGTVDRLTRRIGERFPDADLRRVAGELLRVARTAAARSVTLGRHNYLLRAAIVLLVGTMAGVVGLAFWDARSGLAFRNLQEFIPFFQAAVESLIFIGAGIAFIVTLETRFKRRRALHAVRELSALAHIVDMHQLDKDPVYLLRGGPTTASSPKRTMTSFELNRYLDYCGEMLALIGKLAALYAQNLEDGVALAAVNQLEALSTGLSRKIWQKVMLLDRVPAEGDA
jgi:hypothetical protein